MAVVDRPRPGQRVELQGDPIGVTLTTRTGMVVREDEWEGYYILRLDNPAIYHHPNGETEPLFEIREAEDNFRPLSEQW